ncbi:MAG: ABC transporter substrate-binding protein [Proteobacteria bacterium]|nr:ABC transporter substrate-binding protein [Pseudomonadota bacterium]MBI3498634.1 ABC transporter substrate-binding protein [Pseudomonadota bacterium]
MTHPLCWSALQSAPALLLAASLLAPGTASAQPKVLKYTPQANVGTMDPVNNLSSVTHQHSWLIYDNLFGLDGTGSPQPQMVESFKLSPDGRDYSLTLRPGLKFHDGTPVRVADVIASIKRWAAKDPGGRRLVGLGMELKPADERSFTLTLKEPWGSTTTVLAQGATALFIMREKEATSDPSTPVTEYVGSGPFRFVKDEWQPGSKLVYQKFADYVPRAEPANSVAGGKVAKVDRIEWVILPDATTAVAALNQGEIDIYETPPLDLLPVLKRNKDIQIKVINRQGALGYFRPNFLFPPFNDVRARHALQLIVNQEDYMRAAVGSDPDNWRVCWAVMVCGTPTASEAGSEPYRKPDLAKAKALMAEAGYKGEKIVVLQPVDQQIIRDMAQVTIQRLTDIGVNVEAVAVDWASVLQRGNKKDPPGQGGWHIFSSWSVGQIMGSAINNVQIDSPCDGSGYRGWSCDPEMQRLLGEWAKEGDLAKRKAIGEKIQIQAMTFVQYVPVGQFFQPLAMRANIKGMQENMIPVFWNVEK